MIFRSLAMVLLSSALIAQQAPAPQPAPDKQTPPSRQQSTASTSSSSAEASAAPDEWADSTMHSVVFETGGEWVPPSEAAVPHDGAVMVLHGVCDNQPPSSPDCQTIVTRSDFEAAVDTIDPTMPADARRTLTKQYAETAVLARKAHQLGLENSAGYQTAMDFMSKTDLTRLLGSRLREESKDLTDADVEEFYRENLRLFEEIKMLQIVIPQTKGFGAIPVESRPTPEQIAATHTEMKKEAESIAERAALPEADFQALENEGWKFSNYADAPPDVVQAPKLRWEIWPLTRLPIFDLKVGEVSKVIDEPRNGLYIYKILAKRQVPLEEARTYIRYRYAALRDEDAASQLLKPMKATLNQEYFGGHELTGRPASTPPAPEPQPGKSTTEPTLDIKIPRKLKP
ncbi:MAG: peptidylprolyl isomerase [Terriglobales bacterium]